MTSTLNAALVVVLLLNLLALGTSRILRWCRRSHFRVWCSG